MTTTVLHRSLATGRWSEMTLVEQLANIGSEVGRAARAKEAGNTDRMWSAVERAMELFEFTLRDARWRGRRREICRVRELFCDFLIGDNAFGETAESLDRFFLPFAAAARAKR